ESYRNQGGQAAKPSGQASKKESPVSQGPSTLPSPSPTTIGDPVNKPQSTPVKPELTNALNSILSVLSAAQAKASSGSKASTSALAPGTTRLRAESEAGKGFASKPPLVPESPSTSSSSSQPNASAPATTAQSALASLTARLKASSNAPAILSAAIAALSSAAMIAKGAPATPGAASTPSANAPSPTSLLQAIMNSIKNSPNSSLPQSVAATQLGKQETALRLKKESAGPGSSSSPAVSSPGSSRDVTFSVTPSPILSATIDQSLSVGTAGSQGSIFATAEQDLMASQTDVASMSSFISDVDS
ncbi:hypothetical protein HDU67_004982, partial [Dinochytrium kinnereticum]